MKKLIARLAGAALAVGMLSGVGVATATAQPPIEASVEAATPHVKEAIIKTYVSGARTAYCNWPYRVAINWNGQAHLSVYSPSGWLLGTSFYDIKGYWYTPWEDAYVSYYTTGNYVNVRCYW